MSHPNSVLIRMTYLTLLLVIVPLVLARGVLYPLHRNSIWGSNFNDSELLDDEVEIEPRLWNVELSKPPPSKYECGSYVLAPGTVGTLASPNFGIGDYPSDYHCRWSFQSVDQCKLSVKCDSVNVANSTDCEHDYIAIFADTANSSNNATLFCGENLPTERTSGYANVTVIFHSNEDLVTDIGFKCLVTCKVPPPEPTPSPEPLFCRCGEEKLAADNRIVGGVEPELNAYPWLAGLKYRSGNRPFCVAALISNQYVLTAAHCMDDYYPAHMYAIVMYEHSLLNDTELSKGPPLVFDIEKIIMNENFDAVNMGSDIALLKLVNRIDFDAYPFLSTICLPNKDNHANLTGLITTIAGWGSTSESGRLSNVLLKSEITVISNEDCGLRYPNLISPLMMCAAWKTGGRDSCKGDSGGPLMLKENATWTAVGIVSWGVGCGRIGKPGVYTRITEFLPWIEKNTKDAQYCLSGV